MTDMYFLFETHGSDYHFCPKPNGSRTTMSNELVLDFFTKTMVLCRFSGGATMVLRRLRFSSGRQKWDPIAPTSVSKVVRTRTWTRFESTSAGRTPLRLGHEVAQILSHLKFSG